MSYFSAGDRVKGGRGSVQDRTTAKHPLKARHYHVRLHASSGPNGEDGSLTMRAVFINEPERVQIASFKASSHNTCPANALLNQHAFGGAAG